MMVNWLDPSFTEVSLALHVTVVVPTGNLLPDLTTLPALFVHMMVLGSMAPSKASRADGNGIHVTAASDIPGSTFLERTLFGGVTTGGSMSVKSKRRN